MTDDVLKNKRIFIVEDDPYSIAIVSAILRRAGAEVFYERWGLETQQRLEVHRPIDLIILDLMFPEADGYEVFQEIRKMPGMAEVPVVMVTAADPEREMNHAREMGITGFIAKPINSQTFGEYIAAVLRGEAVWIRDNDFF